MPPLLLVFLLAVSVFAGLVTIVVLNWRLRPAWAIVAGLLAIGSLGALFAPIETHTIRVDLPPPHN
jgi:hypothetical protein